jgi:[ribosomal protein S5]-alanine N-acetyltransferase
MIVAHTQTLLIRHLTLGDASFVLRQLNEPSFLQFIGDRGVRNLIDAENYLCSGPIAGYAANGHGLNAVTLTSSGATIGMCGMLKRDTLPEPDLGYAFLPEYTGLGYAEQACRAVIADARDALGIGAMLAIVQPDNPASIKLLGKLGFVLLGQFDNLLRFRRTADL